MVCDPPIQREEQFYMSTFDSDAHAKRYTPEEIRAEVEATGRDYIPRDCPGICSRIAGHEEDVIAYGRRVFLRRKKAVAFQTRDKPPKGIPFDEAIQIEKEGIADCDKTIKVLLARKETHEASISALKQFAPRSA